MNRTTWLPPALRLTAVAIAIAAAIDPAVTSDRRGRPDVAVFATDPARDSVLVNRVAEQLGSDFTVTRSPFSAAAATVLVGAGLPATTAELNAPVFAVTPDESTPSVRIFFAWIPQSMLLDSRNEVTVEVQTTGRANHSVTASLRVGNATVDQRTMTFGRGRSSRSTHLAFVPMSTGPALLRAVATVDGTALADSVDLATTVRDERWHVLFYDTRPSWQSTFVRRAVESDPRFDVTSRVVTSKNISTDLGAPPAALDNAGSLERYDAIVVGAPELLGDREVAGLEGYLRRRAGSVVLMLDEQPTGPFQRLPGVTNWKHNSDGKTTEIASLSNDSTVLRAAELVWPAALPPRAATFALARAPHPGSGENRPPIVWSIPVGAGTVTVSGALDAWRFRDSATSAFDDYWRYMIAGAAIASARPVSIELSQRVVAPGELVSVTVRLRDPGLQPLPTHASVTTTIEPATGGPDAAVTLWPTSAVGALQGTIRAPDQPGTYQAVAATDKDRAGTSLIVLPRARHDGLNDQIFLTDWVATRGGRAFGASQLSLLAAALRSAIHPTPRRERWHPLRSFWWLLPFALSLSAEWWLRRRRGMA
jgi:hypothetical protein